MRRRRPEENLSVNLVSGYSKTRRAHLFSLFTGAFLSLLLLSTHTSAQEDDDPDEKFVPEKGDGECLSLAERAQSLGTGQNASNLWYRTCDDDILPYNPPPAEVPENGFTLQIFSSLPAFAPHFDFVFTWAVVGYLRDHFSLYDISINSTVEMGLFGGLSPEEDFLTYEAAVVLQQVIPTNVYRDLASHWWRYDLVFHCFWGELSNKDKAGDRLVDAATLRKIQSDMNRSLRRGLQTVVNAFDLWALSNGVLGVTLLDPTTGDDPFEDFVSTLPPVSSPAPSTMSKGEGTLEPSAPGILLVNLPNEEITYVSSLDTQIWDWRRYMGLGVFVGTLAGFILLSQAAAYRRRKITKKQIWGNLGTEEGVDALLNTGWKVKGSRMEVYDKKGLGYRDDDSMLIGGYYEQGAYVGAEITVTQETVTVTTPDTPDMQGSTDSPFRAFS